MSIASSPWRGAPRGRCSRRRPTTAGWAASHRPGRRSPASTGRRRRRPPRPARRLPPPRRRRRPLARDHDRADLAAEDDLDAAPRASAANASVAAAGATGNPMSSRQRDEIRGEGAARGARSSSPARTSGMVSGQACCPSARPPGAPRRRRARRGAARPAPRAGRTCSTARPRAPRYSTSVRRYRSARTWSNGCWTIPELRPEAPAAIADRSYSRTRSPPSARNAAMEVPTIPPPMTATSTAAMARLRSIDGSAGGDGGLGPRPDAPAAIRWSASSSRSTSPAVL